MIAQFLGCLTFFLCLCAPGAALCAGTGRSCEEGLPLAAFGFTALLYVMGLTGLMGYGAVAALLLSACCYGYAIYCLAAKRTSLRSFLSRVCTPAMALFCVFFALCVICNYGRMPYHGDEFSHWAYAVKAMTYLDDFAAAPGAAALYGSYPPAMQLLQYLLQKLTVLFAGGDPGAYSHWLLFIPYQAMVPMLCLPFLKRCSWRNALVPLMMGGAMLALPTAFFPLFYESTFVDPILALTAAYCLAAAWRMDKPAPYGLVCIFMGLFTLALEKDVGLFFALVCGGGLLTRIWGKSAAGRTGAVPSKIGLSLCAALSIGGAKLSWDWVLARYQTPLRFSQPLDAAALWAFLSGQDATPYRAETTEALLARFFGPGCPLGTTGLTLFGHSIPALAFSVSYLAIFLLLMGGCVFAALRKPGRIGLMAVALSGILAYLAGLAWLYLFQFYDFEAVALWCFDRYIGIPLLLLGALLLMLLASRDLPAPAQTDGLNKSTGAWLLACLALICTLAICPVQNLKTYLTRASAKGSA